GSPVRFNLSHAGPNVAVALCEDHDVGLDLESVHPQRAPLPLAKRFSTASETAALRRLPAAQLPHASTRPGPVDAALRRAAGAGQRADRPSRFGGGLAG